MHGQSQTFKYNDTTAGKQGMPVTLDGTTVGQVILADTTDDPIIGYLTEDCVQGNFVGVWMPVPAIDVIAGGAITCGDKVAVTAEGLVNTITMSTSYVSSATTKYMAGIALTTVTTSGDIVKILPLQSVIQTAS